MIALQEPVQASPETTALDQATPVDGDAAASQAQATATTGTQREALDDDDGTRLSRVVLFGLVVLVVLLLAAMIVLQRARARGGTPRE
jgi:hypothetical protein